MTFSKATTDFGSPLPSSSSFNPVEGKQIYNLSSYDKLKRFGYDGTVCEVGDYECMAKHPFFPGSSSIIGPTIPDNDIQPFEPVMKENLEESDTTNNNNADPYFLIGFVAFVIFMIIVYILVLVFAIGKTKNETVKIIIILGFFVPGLQPISFILALLVLFGVIQ